MDKCNSQEYKCQNGDDCLQNTGLSIDALYDPAGIQAWKPFVNTCEKYFLSHYHMFNTQTIQDIEKQATRHLMQNNPNMYPIVMLLAEIFTSFLSTMKCGALILILKYLDWHWWCQFVFDIKKQLLNHSIHTQIQFDQFKTQFDFEYAKCMMNALMDNGLLYRYAVNICVDMRILHSFGNNMNTYIYHMKNEIVNRYKNNTFKKPIASLLINCPCQVTEKQQKLSLDVVSLLFKEIPQSALLQQATTMINSPCTHWDSGYLLLHTLLAINTNQIDKLPTTLAIYSDLYKPPKDTPYNIALNSPVGIIILIMRLFFNGIQFGTLLQFLWLDFPQMTDFFGTLVKYTHDTPQLTKLIFGEMDEGWNKLQWKATNQFVSMSQFIWNEESLKQTANKIQSEEYYLSQRKHCNTTNFIQHLIHQQTDSVVITPGPFSMPLYSKTDSVVITPGPFSIPQNPTIQSLLITDNPQSLQEWRLFLAVQNFFWKQSKKNTQSYESQQHLCLQACVNMKYLMNQDNGTIIQMLHKIQNTSKFPNVSFQNDAHCTLDILMELIYLRNVKCDEEEKKMNDTLANEDTPKERKQKCLMILDKLSMV